MTGKLTLKEHIAREMFVEYKMRVGYWEREKALEGWDTGSAFHSSPSKQPWLDRAEVAIRSYVEWHE